MIKLKD